MDLEGQHVRPLAEQVGRDGDVGKLTSLLGFASRIVFGQVSGCGAFLQVPPGDLRAIHVHDYAAAVADVELQSLDAAGIADAELSSYGQVRNERRVRIHHHLAVPPLVVELGRLPIAGRQGCREVEPRPGHGTSVDQRQFSVRAHDGGPQRVVILPHGADSQDDVAFYLRLGCTRNRRHKEQCRQSKNPLPGHVVPFHCFREAGPALPPSSVVGRSYGGKPIFSRSRWT